MNILYLENHPVFADTVKHQFLSQHSVTVVPSLLAARQAMLADAFDLILVDYDLDDGKGDQFVRDLHASGHHAPIIAVSSHDEGNKALIQAGAAAACSKMQFDKIHMFIHDVTQLIYKDPEAN